MILSFVNYLKLLNVRLSNRKLFSILIIFFLSSLPAIITKTINGFGNENVNITELTLSQEASGIVSQYKDVIREQDVKLKRLEETLKKIDVEKSEIYKQLNVAINSNSQLSDQNILLKAQLTAASDLAQQNGMHSNHVNNVENQMASMNIDYQTQISFYQSENSRLVAENYELKNNFNEVRIRADQNNTELEKLRKDQEDLLELLTDQVSI